MLWDVVRGFLLEEFADNCGDSDWCWLGNFCIYVTYCTIFCMLSGLVVRYVSPQAAGKKLGRNEMMMTFTDIWITRFWIA